MHAASRHGTPSLTSLPKDGVIYLGSQEEQYSTQIINLYVRKSIQNVQFHNYLKGRLGAHYLLGPPGGPLIQGGAHLSQGAY